MNKSVIYPGSFDPVTLGHLDIIIRASKMFDHVVVAVLRNVAKDKPSFTVEERIELLKEATKDLDNIEVVSFDGLLAEYAKKRNITTLVKGLRAVSDFEYEFQMALMNSQLDSNIETLFMTTSAEYSFLSSSSVKQVAKFGGKIEGLVPEEIINDVLNKI